MWWNKKADKPESDTKYKVNQWVHTPYGDGRVVGIRDRYTSEPHYSVSIAGMPWDLWFFESQLHEVVQPKYPRYSFRDWVETSRGPGMVLKVLSTDPTMYRVDVCGKEMVFFESELVGHGYTKVDTEWAAGIDWHTVWAEHPSKYKKGQHVKTPIGVGVSMGRSAGIYAVEIYGKMMWYTEDELSPIYKFKVGDYVIKKDDGALGLGKVKLQVGGGGSHPMPQYIVKFSNNPNDLWVLEDDLVKGEYVE